MGIAYLQFKLAWRLFRKPPSGLSEVESERVQCVARRQADLEQQVLNTMEAAGVVVPDRVVQEHFAQIRSRYAVGDEFHADLADNGLDEAMVHDALYRELRVEAVIEKVAARTPPASLVDAELYYRAHPASFDRPEARRLSHVLVTYDTAAERVTACKVLSHVRSQALSSARFGEAALQYSHCPTAMQAGSLGTVRRGQLFPDIEAVAFALAQDQLSDIVESPVGLHVVRCDEILPWGPVPFDEVAPRIVAALTERRRESNCRAWLRSLSACDAAEVAEVP
ncbi:nitrogen fixation protein NifM [Denitromonas iodatirespirans]|uniref:peptidylprolyl isomerase n=1 Tax=Denitromonas iodatirespirans TaxID=2795389 RepID=A0A944HAE8_DENI1|nr:nitrogen fixation protein NifM [Denitromonas iodatirespirans]MBT0960502.1 nitrogen fixation protein NifM [Denitromonas iodatirespirans]